MKNLDTPNWLINIYLKTQKVLKYLWMQIEYQEIVFQILPFTHAHTWHY